MNVEQQMKASLFAGEDYLDQNPGAYIVIPTDKNFSTPMLNGNPSSSGKTFLDAIEAGKLSGPILALTFCAIVESAQKTREVSELSTGDAGMVVIKGREGFNAMVPGFKG